MLCSGVEKEEEEEEQEEQEEEEEGQKSALGKDERKEGGNSRASTFLPPFSCPFLKRAIISGNLPLGRLYIPGIPRKRREKEEEEKGYMPVSKVSH